MQAGDKLLTRANLMKALTSVSYAAPTDPDTEAEALLNRAIEELVKLRGQVEVLSPVGLIGDVFSDVCAEIIRAKSLHPGDFHSDHEAYAVTLEEFEEVWAEVKKKHPDRAAIRAELIQTLAMLFRWYVEIGGVDAWHSLGKDTR